MASDIDVFGLTDQGKVRKENQDQFLIASLHKTMQIQSTSLPPERLPELMSESRGFVFLVADGVGGMPGGQHASGTALSTIAHYVTHTMRLYYHHDPDEESKFLADLQESVLHSHSLLRAEGEADPLREGMATTLTLVAVLWPRAYVVHVGDSRLYILRQGRLDQITKDQTMAQALVDAGVLDSANLERSPFKSILSSAVGGSQATPMTTVTDVRWDDVMLLCTDGLTKHVTEGEIQQHLTDVHSAELICRKLVDLALERGGSDNVTVVAGRLKRNAGIE
jgi:protein phosphatase